jgi:hypothetical protein
MKRLAFSTLAVLMSIALFVFLLSGCDGKQAEWRGKIKDEIKVKDQPVPHGKVLIHFDMIIGDGNLISDMTNLLTRAQNSRHIVYDLV